MHVDPAAASGQSGESWADPISNLHDALSAAGTGGLCTEVWVKAGTYRPDVAGGDRNAAFTVPDGVSVLGGFAGTETDPSMRTPGNVTRLSGDLNQDDGNMDYGDNSFTVMELLGSALIDNLTIADGAATGSGSDAITRRGGGLYADVASGAVIQLEGLTFEDNRALDAGGGAYIAGGVITATSISVRRNLIVGTGANLDGGAGMSLRPGVGGATVSDCLFTENTIEVSGAPRGGAGIEARANPVSVSDCRFESNSAPRAPAIAGFEGLVVTDSQFVDNAASDTAGAIFEENTGTLEVDACLFVGNQAANAGSAIYSNGATTVVNSRFYGNRTNTGGTVFADASAQVKNNIFAGNVATGDGAAASILLRDGDVMNNVFHGNSGAIAGPKYTTEVADDTIANNIFTLSLPGIDEFFECIGAGTKLRANIVNVNWAPGLCDLLEGNQLGEPLYRRPPLSFDFAISILPVDVELADTTGYDIGDQVMLNHDGILRTIAQKDGQTITVTPSPPADFDNGAGDLVENYGPAGAAPGFDLLTGSPCIDSGYSGDGVLATDIDGNARVDDADTTNAGSGPILFWDIGPHEFQ